VFEGRAFALRIGLMGSVLVWTRLRAFKERQEEVFRCWLVSDRDCHWPSLFTLSDNLLIPYAIGNAYSILVY